MCVPQSIGAVENKKEGRVEDGGGGGHTEYAEHDGGRDGCVNGEDEEAEGAGEVGDEVETEEDDEEEDEKATALFAFVAYRWFVRAARSSSSSRILLPRLLLLLR